MLLPGSMVSGLLFGFSVMFKRYIEPPVLYCFCLRFLCFLYAFGCFFILPHCGYLVLILGGFVRTFVD